MLLVYSGANHLLCCGHQSCPATLSLSVDSLAAWLLTHSASSLAGTPFNHLQYLNSGSTSLQVFIFAVAVHSTVSHLLLPLLVLSSLLISYFCALQTWTMRLNLRLSEVTSGLEECDAELNLWISELRQAYSTSFHCLCLNHHMLNAYTNMWKVMFIEAINKYIGHCLIISLENSFPVQCTDSRITYHQEISRKNGPDLLMKMD